MGTLAAPVTIEQFLQIESTPEIRLELIEGTVIEMSTGGTEHESVKGTVLEILAAYNSRSRVGKIYADSMFDIAGNALIPDVAFVSRDRLAAVTSGRRLQGSPDFAIEVVSSESAEHLEAKTRLYLAHGAKSAWILYPATASMLIRRATGETQHLESGDTFDEPALGFSIVVADLFS